MMSMFFDVSSLCSSFKSFSLDDFSVLGRKMAPEEFSSNFTSKFVMLVSFGEKFLGFIR